MVFLLQQFVVTFALSRIGTYVLNYSMMNFAKLYRKSEIIERKFEGVDILCIITNMFVETAFLVYITNTYAQHSFTPKRFVVPIVFFRVLTLYIVDDFLYSPYHYFLHRPFLYRHIHSIHHKMSHPYKGYLHAVMEHPLEMIGALYLHIFSLYLIDIVLNIDRFSMYLHITLKACLACLNHSGYEIELRFLHYKSIAHHIHHRYRTKNYHQNLKLW